MIDLVVDTAQRTRGHSREVCAATGEDTHDLTVTVNPTEPRAGWAQSVDTGLGVRRAGAALARHLVDHHSSAGTQPQTRDTSAAAVIATEALALGESTTWPGIISSFVLGYLLGAHGQDALSSNPAPVAGELVLTVDVAEDVAEVEAAVNAAVTLAQATVTARSLAGAPANRKTPEQLTQWMGSELSAAGMNVDILDEHALTEGGFGGILAVGAGAANPPRLLIARKPGNGTRVLLVGKGITFDTGGISLKPANDLHLMRTDMAGSAAVVAAAASYCAHAPGGDDLDLTVVVAAAENMPSGTAYRPGDVVTHRGGTTTIATNTDAEGRMVLADALVYGIELADPDLVVDVATLTGAMKIALGVRTGAIMGTDDELCERLAHAGSSVGERWWRLPLVDDLRSTVVDSPLADRKQAPGGPGAITAALFLEGFVDERPWVHLDVAGPARAADPLDEVNPVATGFATRSLIGFLRDLGTTRYPKAKN